jgi:hypothetical protein
LGIVVGHKIIHLYHIFLENSQLLHTFKGKLAS